MKQYESDNTAYSRDTFQCLKGYLAICILVHHLYQFGVFLSGSTLGYPFLLLGHWGVVIFMFMSGFGLFSSYLSKGDTYIKSFFRARLLPFYVTYLFFVALYTCFELINGKEITASEILHSLTYGGTIISFGWYLQLTLLMYLLFYILKLIFRNEGAFIYALCISVLIFLIINFCLSSQKNVYEPSFAFVLGVIFAGRNYHMPVLFSQKPVPFAVIGLLSFLAITLVTTLIVFRYSDVLESNILADLLYLLLMMVADLSLVIFVLTFNVIANRSFSKVIVNPVSRFLGKYSLEIYALQGLFLRLLNNKISNRAVYAAVAVSCIILFSIPVHMFLSSVKKALSKKA